MLDGEFRVYLQQLEPHFACFFVLALAPVYFVQVAFTRFSWVSDHWQYWASMGLIALVVGVVGAVGARGARWKPIPATRLRPNSKRPLAAFCLFG